MARANQVAAGGWQGQRRVDWLGREALRLPQVRCHHQDGNHWAIEARRDRGTSCFDDTERDYHRRVRPNHRAQ